MSLIRKRWLFSVNKLIRLTLLIQVLEREINIHAFPAEAQVPPGHSVALARRFPLPERQESRGPPRL
jgi:hypothetical protein